VKSKNTPLFAYFSLAAIDKITGGAISRAAGRMSKVYELSLRSGLSESDLLKLYQESPLPFDDWIVYYWNVKKEKESK
jgi:hypothetical protein